MAMRRDERHASVSKKRRENIVMKVQKIQEMHQIELSKEKLAALLRYLLNNKEKPIKPKTFRMWFIVLIQPHLWERV